MEILITNDDGWGSAGLNCLLRTVSSLGHLTILVPDRQRSGVSSAVTPCSPLYLKPMDTPDWLPADAAVYLTNGTPSDCVKMAINVLFGGDDSKINLLLSGINHGSNAAINLIYSGTMGAVFVGAEHNIPAIGFSIDDLSSEPDFSYFEPYILTTIRHLLDEGFRPGMCYNINAPKGPISGLRWTRQARSHWENEMRPEKDEQGKTCYFLAGYMVDEEPEATDTDQYAITHGFISIQPCCVDMTDYHSL